MAEVDIAPPAKLAGALPSAFQVSVDLGIGLGVTPGARDQIREGRCWGNGESWKRSIQGSGQLGLG